jgi:LacI family transcriptional regulator
MSIAEVAKAAGVSTATVSRVLNELPGVRDETIRQVRAAVEALNYTPRRAKRTSPGGPPGAPRGAAVGSPRHGSRTGNIAVITLGQTRDWLQLPVMAAVVAGIQRAAGEFGLRLLLDDMPDPQKPSSLIQGRQIDGAVVFVTSTMGVPTFKPVLDDIKQRIPIVWAMGLESSATGVDHVTPDNISIGYLAHSFLTGKNAHKDVGFVSVNPEWAFMRLRGQAFLNAAYDAGHPGTAYIVTSDPMVAESYGKRVVTAHNLDELVAAMAKTTPRPTGLFIANDATTAMLHPLLHHHNLKPGHDLTLVSCDNEQIRLSALQPRPASIDTGAEQVGFRAVIRLMSRIRRPDEPTVVVQVSPRLVEA